MTKALEEFFLDELDFELICERYWSFKTLTKVYLEEIHKRLKEIPQDVSCGGDD